MGCGNSKPNPEGELVPLRIRAHHLRSKLSELRKRKNNGVNLSDGTLSKKVLLNKKELEEDNSMLVDNRKSMSSSPNGSQNSFASQQHTKQDKAEDLAIPLSNNATNHLLEEKHPDETPVQLKENKIMDEHTYIEEGDESKKKAGEEARPDNEENRCFICPGSPSFRVYFVEETKDDKENVQMKDTGIEDDSHKKSLSHDSVESTTCSKFGEGQESKTIKKVKKGTSFNRVISRKRPVGVGVKKLLKVKSCYHLSCSGNDRANLIARKAEA